VELRDRTHDVPKVDDDDVVALLPQDAQALDDDYRRVTEI
jgi:hypothetical protein